MINEVKTGKYVYNNEEKEFKFNTNMSMSIRTEFVINVCNIIVTSDSYNYLLRNMIFDFELIAMMTDIDVSDLKEIDDIYDFLDVTNVADMIKCEIDIDMLNSLNIAVDKNIEYLTGIHENKISNSISNILNKINDKLSGLKEDEMNNLVNVLKDINNKTSVENIVKEYRKIISKDLKKTKK